MQIVCEAANRSCGTHCRDIPNTFGIMDSGACGPRISSVRAKRAATSAPQMQRPTSPRGPATCTTDARSAGELAAAGIGGARQKTDSPCARWRAAFRAGDPGTAVRLPSRPHSRERVLGSARECISFVPNGSALGTSRHMRRYPADHIVVFALYWACRLRPAQRSAGGCGMAAFGRARERERESRPSGGGGGAKRIAQARPRPPVPLPLAALDAARLSMGAWNTARLLARPLAGVPHAPRRRKRKPRSPRTTSMLLLAASL